MEFSEEIKKTLIGKTIKSFTEKEGEYREAILITFTDDTCATIFADSTVSRGVISVADGDQELGGV